MGMFSRDKCLYHPDRDAVGKCGECKQPICGECAIALTPGFRQKKYCAECAPKVFAKMLGGGCPLCQAEGTLTYSGKERDTFICGGCGAELTVPDEWDRSRLVSGKSDYIGKLLTVQYGWKLVREGRKPFVCPKCGVQPYRLELSWEEPEKVKDGKRLRCNNCLVDLRVEGGRLVEDMSEKVESSPKYYAVKLGTPVESIAWKWPECCSVCLGPAEKAVEVRAEGSEWQGAVVETTTMTLRGVPYCQNCYEKAQSIFSGQDLTIGPVKDNHGNMIGLLFGFRNPGYARMFRDLNACYEQGTGPFNL